VIILVIPLNKLSLTPNSTLKLNLNLVFTRVDQLIFTDFQIAFIIISYMQNSEVLI
jgi:hypothetical protein